MEVAMPFGWKGGAIHSDLPDNKCGAICRKCGRGAGCTKQFHSQMVPHYSNRSVEADGQNGCGHTWENPT